MKRLALLLLLLVTAAVAAPREWKTGKLISIEQARMPDDTNVRLSRIQFAAGDYEYFGESTIKVVWHHGPKLTENGSLKFSLDGDTLRIQDEDGKEFKYRLLKKRKVEN